MKDILVRLDRCQGCHSCELACAVAHSTSGTPAAAARERPLPRRRLYVEQVEAYKVPILCRHCEEAPCVHACRTGALRQDPLTRIVSHDAERCIGCWMCTMVCPYGVIGRRAEERIAVKCDRCPDLEVPACVAACPTKALIYAEAEGFAGLRRSEAAKGMVESFRSGQEGRAG